MKKDIILCGVGGQGILSIATIIGEAATKAGLYLVQTSSSLWNPWKPCVTLLTSTKRVG